MEGLAIIINELRLAVSFAPIQMVGTWGFLGQLPFHLPFPYSRAKRFPKPTECSLFLKYIWYNSTVRDSPKSWLQWDWMWAAISQHGSTMPFCLLDPWVFVLAWNISFLQWKSPDVNIQGPDQSAQAELIARSLAHLCSHCTAVSSPVKNFPLCISGSMLAAPLELDLCFSLANTPSPMELKSGKFEGSSQGQVLVGEMKAQGPGPWCPSSQARALFLKLHCPTFNFHYAMSAMGQSMCKVMWVLFFFFCEFLIFPIKQSLFPV